MTVTKTALSHRIPMTPLTTNEETVAKLDMRIEENYFIEHPRYQRCLQGIIHPMSNRLRTYQWVRKIHLLSSRLIPKSPAKQFTAQGRWLIWQCSRNSDSEPSNYEAAHSAKRSRIGHLTSAFELLRNCYSQRRDGSAFAYRAPRKSSIGNAGTPPSIAPKLQVTTPGETTIPCR